MHTTQDRAGNVIAEADGTTGIVAKEYIWLPVDAVVRAPSSEGVNRIAQENAGYAGTDLPVGVVDVAGTATPELLYVHADHVLLGAADSRSLTRCRRTIGARGPWGNKIFTEACPGAGRERHRQPHFRSDTPR